MAPKRGGKALVPTSKKKHEKVTNPLFEKRPKQFGIGGALPPKRDLTRLVKWPKTVQIQRKTKILKQRGYFLDYLLLILHVATSLFKILLKYRSEGKAKKKERLLKRAQAETEGKTVEAKKPTVLKYVIWLPALCRKMEIPYCIVKGKVCLGS
ncbi:60S ribosomal protein L7a-1, partial [Stylosanthes scabra]|nr:60S ribosomal protein L7a-1 [Stylosanthes scabra]